MPSAAFPASSRATQEAADAHQEEEHIEASSERQVLPGVQRDVDQIGRDPDEPILDELASLKVRGGKA